MRRETIIDSALFQKGDCEWIPVTLPHTWNAMDGQEGGGHYYRGVCQYKLKLPGVSAGKCQFIRFGAASTVATIFCNGVLIGNHRGGFSSFSFDLTEYLGEFENELTVCVDNSQNPDVYPTMGDFTIFGGLYRNVTLVETEREHFDFGKYGSRGIFVTPDLNTGKVRIDAFTVNAQNCEVVCRVDGAEMRVKAEEHSVLTFTVENPLPWDGMENPKCYEALLRLEQDGEVLDEVTEIFGFRSVRVDPEKGFYLNGRSYPLRGVGRHQDYFDKGWALGKQEQEQDVRLICEMGANAVRLAHYQHNDDFYSLCDRAGLAVWAEIPFISDCVDTEEARKNIKDQLLELICQNYNHPSILFWGIGNELTMCGSSEGMEKTCVELNDLCHRIDPERLTAMALMSTDRPDSVIANITDVSGFNQYLGWYVGKTQDNGPWLDAQHELCPKLCIGLTEYGCDAVLGWHSSAPQVKDYTEEYQAIYHQAMLEAISSRPWLWGTFVWNMFDFAASARDEGGSKGRNNKGLVSYDRKVRKDAYYLYRAWWTNEPFVYIAGRRFVKRAVGQRTVRVYSNQESVSLSLNGTIVLGKEIARHIFEFPELPLVPGENMVQAQCEGAVDFCVFCGVSEPDPEYVFMQKDDSENVRNWFGHVLDFPEGYYSIRDTMETLTNNPKTVRAMEEAIAEMVPDQAMAGQMARMFCGIHASITMEEVLRAAGNNLPPTARSVFNQKLTKIIKTV